MQQCPKIKQVPHITTKLTAVREWSLLFIEQWFTCCCTTISGIEYEISHVNTRIQGQ